jgi:hypothetical protein
LADDRREGPGLVFMRTPESPKPRKPAAGAKVVPPGSIAARIDDVERTIERVRGLFEAHFLGIERRAPEVQRLELQRKLDEVRRAPLSNTALKFRLDTLVQRVTVLSTYWSRTLREIEMGTYRRDVFKAERQVGGRAAGETAGRPPVPGDKR